MSWLFGDSLICFSKQVSWRTRALVVTDWTRRFVFGRDSSRIWINPRPGVGILVWRWRMVGCSSLKQVQHCELMIHTKFSLLYSSRKIHKSRQSDQYSWYNNFGHIRPMNLLVHCGQQWAFLSMLLPPPPRLKMWILVLSLSILWFIDTKARVDANLSLSR